MSTLAFPLCIVMFFLSSAFSELDGRPPITGDPELEQPSRFSVGKWPGESYSYCILTKLRIRGYVNLVPNTFTNLQKLPFPNIQISFNMHHWYVLFW